MAFPSVTYTFTNSTTADATQVNQNFTDMINGLSDGTKNLNMSAATFASTLTANGAVTLGTSSSNSLTVNASLNSSILLTTNVAFDIGGTSFGLRALYFGNGATNTLKILTGTLTGSWTWTLPVAAPAANNSYMSFTSGGVSSFVAFKAPVVTVLTSTGTYTTPTSPAPLYLKVTVVGGGASGGSPNASFANAGAGGGGGGATAIKTIVSPLATYAYAVGAGGTAPAVANGGNAGATSTFGTAFLSAAGGAAGGVGQNTTPGGGGNGGTATGGDINISGQGGGAGGVPTAGTNNGGSGVGGGSYLGGGGAGVSNTGAGNAGTGYGGGGAGGTGQNGTGGAGFAGTIVVEEFYQ